MTLKSKIAVALTGTTMLAGTGVAFAAWQSEAPNQSARGRANSISFTVAGEAPTAGDLYPGVNGAVRISVTNNRPFAIRLDSLSAGTVDTAAAACSVSSNAKTDLGLTVPANGSASFTVTDALTMANDAAAKANSCQGIDVTVTGITATASAFNA